MSHVGHTLISPPPRLSPTGEGAPLPPSTTHALAHRDDNDEQDDDDEARAASLAGALGFLQLFNRRCCPLGGGGRAVHDVYHGGGGMGEEGPTDLDVDDIVEEED